MTKKKIVSIGEILWDVFPEKKCFGGAPANFAFHANSLGAEAVIVSAVGEDELGDDALLYLQEHGLDVSYISKVADRSTGYVDVALDGKGVATYSFPDDVAWDNLPWYDELASVAEGADIVCFSTIAQRSEVSRMTIDRFIGHCREDCLRVYDVNLRAGMYDAGTVLRLLRCCDIVKLNEDELPLVLKFLVSENTGFKGGIEALIKELSLKAIIYTCGEQGSQLYTPDGVVSADAVSCNVVSTVGAGDSFTAAVLTGILRGSEPEENLAHAAKVAAYVCEHEGAMVPLPVELVG